MISKCFLDSIHGNIPICKYALQIIHTPEFQRLKKIKQLGNVHHVYMGAVHTRFEHSIGVSYLCGELITNLRSNQKELNITDRDITLIKIAGLCHDIGHGCFSHVFDNHFLKLKLRGTSKEKYIDHEYRSECIVRHIIKKYDFDYTDEEVDIICEYISPKERTKKPKYMYQIVANIDSGLDCDKIDYLIRDPKSTGNIISFNYKLLLERARVIDNDICFPYDDAIDIQQMFSARYYMHKKVYQHPTIKALDHMITTMLCDLDSRLHISDNIDNIDAFCECTDSIIDIDAYMHKNTITCDLRDQINLRDIYKVIYKTTTVDTIMNERLMLHTANDNISNVIIDIATINYNSKTSNPLSRICFYNRKSNIDVKFKTNDHEIIVPTTFSESMMLIIFKKPDNELQTKILKFICDYAIIKQNSFIC